MESGVVCRWVHRESGVVFDLMPVDSEVLGFSNRWYAYAVETAQSVELDERLSIRMVTAVALVATKLDAFATRGQGDFLSRHDLEDVLNVVDGRAELVDEIAMAPEDLRHMVASAFAALMDDPAFANALPGLVAEPGRAGIVRERLQAMLLLRPQ